MTDKDFIDVNDIRLKTTIINLFKISKKLVGDQEITVSLLED